MVLLLYNPTKFYIILMTFLSICSYYVWNKYHDRTGSLKCRMNICHKMHINVREYRRGNKKWTIQRNGQGEEKRNKEKTQYVLNTTI